MRTNEPTIGKLPKGKEFKPGTHRVTFNMHKVNPAFVAGKVASPRWQETRLVQASTATELQVLATNLLAGEIRELWERGGQEEAKASSITVADYADEYFRKHIAPRGRVNTMANVRSIIERHVKPFLGKREVASLTSRDLEDFQEYIRTSIKPRKGGTARASSVVVTWRRFMAIINQAITDGLLTIQKVKAPVEASALRKEAQIESWDDDEIDVFVRLQPELLTTQEGRMALTALYTGLRPCELLALEWRDVKWSDEEIDVAHSTVYLSAEQAKLRGLRGPVRVQSPHKTKAGRRRVALHAGVATVLREQRKVQLAGGGSNFVFAGEDGNYLLDTPGRWFHAFCKAHGLRRIVFYSLRHCFATLMLGRFRVDYKTLQHAMGHEKIEITIGTYCHLTRGMQDAARHAFSSWVVNLLGEVPIEEAI